MVFDRPLFQPFIEERLATVEIGKAMSFRDQRAAEIAYKTLGSVMESSFDAMVDDMKREGVKVHLLEPRENPRVSLPDQ